ncbi:hypothetical protein M758_UG235500 [Ceratodon purpureus]|nr:hypothetical protein M758_UG235500 [Ceratodon purpureus]
MSMLDLKPSVPHAPSVVKAVTAFKAVPHVVVCTLHCDFFCFLHCSMSICLQNAASASFRRSFFFLSISPFLLLIVASVPPHVQFFYFFSFKFSMSGSMLQLFLTFNFFSFNISMSSSLLQLLLTFILICVFCQLVDALFAA